MKMAEMMKNGQHDENLVFSSIFDEKRKKERKKKKNNSMGFVFKVPFFTIVPYKNDETVNHIKVSCNTLTF